MQQQSVFFAFLNVFLSDLCVSAVNKYMAML